MLVRLVAATLVLAGCSAGDTASDDIATAAQAEDAAGGPDCSTVVALPEPDPVAQVRLVDFAVGDGGFEATVEVQPLDGGLELRDVPRPILGRASEAPDGPGVAPAPPIAGVANAALLTATVDAPLELVVVGGYPAESRSPLWVNASIPSLGTFSCLMTSNSVPDVASSTTAQDTTTSTTAAPGSSALLPEGPPTVTGTVGVNDSGHVGALENASDVYYEGMWLMGLADDVPVVVDATSSEQVHFSSLRVGDRVSVWVVGACAEPVPVLCPIAAVAVEPRE